jgi:hypothetical protein
VVDVFEEVEEQLRSERVRTLLRTYLPWVLGAIAAGFLVALGVWGYDQFRLKGVQQASQAYASGLDSLGHGDSAKAYTQFAVAAGSSSAAYRSLGLMQQAGIRMDQGKTKEAVVLFDEAAKAAPDNALGDVARLKSALALLDTAAYADLEARLKPLADPKRPYSVMAREALAMAKLRVGKTAEARGDFVVLSLISDAPDDVRQRARAAIAVIDSGTASGLSATVKAGLQLPPPPINAPPADPNVQPGAGQ